MKIWVDAQLPPALANWLTDTFELEADALRDLALRFRPSILEEKLHLDPLVFAAKC